MLSTLEEQADMIAHLIVLKSGSGERAVICTCPDGNLVFEVLFEHISSKLNVHGFSIGNCGHSLKTGTDGLYFVPGDLVRSLGATPPQHECEILKLEIAP